MKRGSAPIASVLSAIARSGNPVGCGPASAIARNVAAGQPDFNVTLVQRYPSSFIVHRDHDVAAVFFVDEFLLRLV